MGGKSALTCSVLTIRLKGGGRIDGTKPQPIGIRIARNLRTL